MAHVVNETVRIQLILKSSLVTSCMNKIEPLWIRPFRGVLVVTTSILDENLDVLVSGSLSSRLCMTRISC